MSRPPVTHYAYIIYGMYRVIGCKREALEVEYSHDINEVTCKWCRRHYMNVRSGKAKRDDHGWVSEQGDARSG